MSSSDNNIIAAAEECANCGKGEGSELKSCGACKIVKYCNAACQVAHRPQHEEECRKCSVTDTKYGGALVKETKPSSVNNKQDADGPCPKLHGAPRTRKIIKAKRPPMSNTPTHRISAAVVSNKTAIITPPKEKVADSVIVMKRERSISKSFDAPKIEVDVIQYNEQTEYVYMGIRKEKVPTNVVTVRFDSNVSEVEHRAFRSCTMLRKVIMNEGLQQISRLAFYNCTSLEEVNLPSTVKRVEDSAFSNCSQLKKVAFNEGLEMAGEWSFGGCISLEDVTFPSTLKRIDRYAFSGCVSLKEVFFGEGLESISHGAFAGCRLLREVVFNDSLQVIGNDAFSNCYNLNKVEVNENIQGIHNQAFRGCSLLQQIKLQTLSTRLSTIVQAGQTQVEGKVNEILGFYLGCRDEQLYLNAQAYAAVGAGQPDLNLWKQIKKSYLGRIDNMISFYEMKEATTIFELAWWKDKIDNPEEGSPATREECRTDVPGPVKDTILQYLSYPHYLQ